MPEPLIVDANPIISALLGGAARAVIFAGRYTLYSPQYTLFEVEKYIPMMARKLGRRELDLLRNLNCSQSSLVNRTNTILILDRQPG